MDGIIVVDKPRGWTSFDVCAKLRNLTKTQKVGHSGTLDPMATGVLVCFLGRATKTIQNHVGADKEYEGEMTLGVETDTMDATGKTLTHRPSDGPPSPYGRGKSELCEDRVRELFKKHLGKQKQKPPMYSAKKINGKRLYELARQGIEIERPDKDIEIHSFDLLDIKEDKIRFRLKCSKGTYVRVLAHDIGQELGCGAHLSALQRTAAGSFRIEQARTIDQIITLSQENKLATILITHPLIPSLNKRGETERSEEG